MTADTSTTPEAVTSESETDAPVAAVVYDKGTWQAAIQRASQLFDRSGKDRKRASTLLWQGATSAIAEWEAENADTDVSAEGLSGQMLDIMGTARKGDVSKIKTVALAVRNHGLQTSAFPNLSKAYAEARRLTTTVQQNAAEDAAADDAVQAIAAALPTTPSTPEDAARIVLAKGLDEAARLLLDALGASNEAAHRSFLRAVSQEIAGRVKPAPKPASSGPKAGATQAKSGAAKKATAKKATPTKPKANAAKATPAKKATPVSASKGDPNRKALPAKAAPVKAAPAPATA